MIKTHRGETCYCFWNGGICVNDNSAGDSCIVTDLVNEKSYQSSDKRLMYKSIAQHVLPCYCGLELAHWLLLTVLGKENTGLFLRKREEYYNEWRVKNREIYYNEWREKEFSHPNFKETLKNFPMLQDEYNDGFEMRRFKYRRQIAEKKEIINKQLTLIE